MQNGFFYHWLLDYLLFIAVLQRQSYYQISYPENADDLIFEDDSDNCKFKTQEVKCPIKNKINQIPMPKKKYDIIINVKY